MNQKKFWAMTLSAFVFPGAGHIVLGEKIKGLVIALLAGSVFLYLFILFEKEMFHQLNLFIPEPNLASIAPLIISASKNSWRILQQKLIGGLVIVFLIWGYGILDLVFKKETPKSA